MPDSSRPLALVTGVGRSAGIGAAIARRLAADGWDVATTHDAGFDREQHGDAVLDEPEQVRRELESLGARTFACHADLGEVGAAADVFAQVNAALGPVTALVANHARCVETALLDTTPEELDRHLAVNVRGLLLLVQAFVAQYRPGAGPGRIVTMTSDHVAGNVGYGVSKGAADRVVDAAARELGHLGITANAINPGPTDTGWMDDAIRTQVAARTPLARLGTGTDAANLVAFLCSPEGGWITGQLLQSSGGYHGTL